MYIWLLVMRMCWGPGNGLKGSRDDGNNDPIPPAYNILYGGAEGEGRAPAEHFITDGRVVGRVTKDKLKQHNIDRGMCGESDKNFKSFVIF